MSIGSVGTKVANQDPKAAGNLGLDTANSTEPRDLGSTAAVETVPHQYFVLPSGLRPVRPGGRAETRGTGSPGSKADFDLYQSPIRPVGSQREVRDTSTHVPRRHTGAGVALLLALTLGGGALALCGLGSTHETAATPPPMVQVQPADSDQVQSLIQQRFGDAENVHVSHNWALGIANNGQDDMSVLLHKAQGQWSIAASDGGAYDAATLAQHQVPPADIQALLQTYQ